MTYAHRQALGDSLIKRSMGRTVTDGTFVSTLTEDALRARSFVMIERLGSQLARTTGQLFTVRPALHLRPARLSPVTGIADRLLHLIRSHTIPHLCQQYSAHSLSPRFSALAAPIIAYHLDDRMETMAALDHNGLLALAADMNTATDEIRRNLRLKTFQTAVSNFESTARKNSARLAQYITDLWRHHPVLYVVRLDVGWPVPPPSFHSLFDPNWVSPVEQHKAFSRFRTTAPRRLPKAVPASQWLGYAWKIDHPGMQIALQERPLPHMHFFIFFSQASQHHRESIIQCLADTWRQVTRGVGVYRDGTAPGISGHGAAGTGMFHRTQPEQVKALRQALLLMTKADYLARYKFPLFPEFRTFGKGQLPR